MDYGQHKLDYCEFLISSQINYTQTYLADHHEHYSHDSMNRFLRFDKMTPSLLWKNVSDDVVESENGYLIFDDMVLDKRHSQKSSLVRRQWSGNEKRVIRGIGVVTCVYVNPELKQFWLIDYRIYDPQGDGQSKVKHMLEMLDNVHYSKNLAYKTVLMDSWYASMEAMKHIEKLGKIYYCPIKSNRLVDDSDGISKHVNVKNLSWSETTQQEGKLVHLKKMPKGHRVKLFRLVLSTQRTDYVVTNDLTQDDLDATKQHCGIRWNIEQLHRESKQVTGIESCQCRVPRALRNHIACSFLVWIHLKRWADKAHTNIYRLKFSLLDNYMIDQLKNPPYPMTLRA